MDCWVQTVPRVEGGDFPRVSRLFPGCYGDHPAGRHLGWNGDRIRRAELAGVLLVLIVLGRRAEAAAYSQIAGKPGAVGAVLKSGLRRSWTGSEMPVVVNKSQDAVYRAVGRGGVVLIGEGPRSRTQPMLDKERANVHRILPNVPVNLLYVGPDPDSIGLSKIVPALARFKRTLTKAEVMAVSNRLASLGRNGIPIPKGIDPNRVRAPRPR